MSKIAIIGLTGAVEIFSLLGVEIFIVKDKAEAISFINSLSKQEFGLIFLTKELYEQIPRTMKKYSLNLKPIISQIPY